MGIVVPALRLVFVLVNVYDTFKTLKLPPPSARNNGQPTVRALSQRKRAMKGSLAVWLIWFCYALYERTAERIVGIFIPFYSEIKALVLLFFILTRSRGAEPIYLHLIRPLVKPYTETLDVFLDISQNLGDILFIFLAIPVHFVTSLRSRWVTAGKEEDRAQEAMEEPPVIPEYLEDVPPEEVFGTARTRRRPLQDAQARARAGSAPGLVRPASHVQDASHEIWHPPTSAYHDSPPTAPKGLPTPPAEDQLQKARDIASDEWRQYEPFPAAYPLSPVQATVSLPMDFSTRLTTYGGIYQEPQQAHLSSAQQGFRRSLQLPRESVNPDSDGDLSDDRHIAAGVRADDDEMSVDEDYEDEDDEDDFDVTLRTPLRISRVQNVSNMTSTSVESRSYASTSLSTVDHGSPLRTRTNSEVSATLVSSDESSVAGQKRPLRTLVDEEARTRPALKAKISDNGTIRAKPTVRTRARPAFVARPKSPADDSSASGTENRTGAGAPGPAPRTPKKRPGVLASRKSPVHRAPVRTGTSVLKPKAPVAHPRVVRKVTAAPRAASVRPPAVKARKPLIAKVKESRSSPALEAEPVGLNQPTIVVKPPVEVAQSVEVDQTTPTKQYMADSARVVA